jgi:hypothetical protein
MKMVKFTKSMSPHGVGDTRVVPDEIARRLVDEDVAEIVPSMFDATKKKPGYLTRGSANR